MSKWKGRIMGFFREFKEFINQGDVMDMAVGIIIGGALTAIVTALTSDIIQPLINFVTGGNAEVGGLVIPGTEIDFGSFISACINFIIIAFVVFCLVKGVNKMRSVGRKPVEQADVPTCPYCLEEVKEGSTRCPHCAAAFDSPATAG